MTSDQVQTDYDQLQDLLSGFEDLRSFLDEVTILGSHVMTEITGARVECAVTLHRHKRPTTIAGSSDDAVRLDKIEQSIGGGPCMQALKTGTPVLLGDVASDPRWPRYRKALAEAGCSSSLGLPLSPGKDAAAALNFFASPDGPITEPMVARATAFAESAGLAMGLAIRIAGKDELADDLKLLWKSGPPLTWPRESSWDKTVATRTKRSRSS